MGLRHVLDSLADPRAIVLSYFRSHGLQAGRLDYCESSQTLYLTVLLHGEPRYISIPLATTFTAGRLATLLTEGNLQELIDRAPYDRSEPQLSPEVGPVVGDRMELHVATQPAIETFPPP